MDGTNDRPASRARAFSRAATGPRAGTPGAHGQAEQVLRMVGGEALRGAAPGRVGRNAADAHAGDAA